MPDTNKFSVNTPAKSTPEAESPSTVASQHEFLPIAPYHHGPSSLPGGGGQHLPQIPGATVYTPTTVPGAELNPRSCVTCRRRKVRCDKHMPCSNCRRALIPCIFPAPERAPRRPRRKDPSTLRPTQSSEREIELLKRLRKLENIVEELSGQVELETTKPHSSNGGSPETNAGSHRSSLDLLGGGGGSGHDTALNSPATGSNRGYGSPMLRTVNNNNSGSSGQLVCGNNNSSYGALVKHKATPSQLGGVIDDYGRSRYVSSAFWGKINDELDELRMEAQKISDPDSDVSEAGSSPTHSVDRPEADHHVFVFGFQSTAVDLRALHPLPSQIPYIWQVYQENVDPLVKFLHIPTTSKLIRGARTNLDNISPAAEALMFAVYYAAVGSLEESEIKVNFMNDKATLINKYRFALEQALAKANFLTSSELVTLQAFVLFVVLVRRHDDTRLAWTMTGLAIRIGHSIGLHRDGSHFPSLKPFEVEMRRRLFWAICVLDMRSAEDQGTELSIVEPGFDTSLPLNINDADISPDSTVLPPSREGVTDMTFSLIRFEICRVARRLHALNVPPGLPYRLEPSSSLEERENLIREVYEHVQKQYLARTGDTSGNPVFWVATNLARVICAKMLLVIYQPMLLPGPGNEDLSRDRRDRLFIASTELFEYSYTLNTDPRTKQWRWLFQMYTQWYAVAYTLMESARRPWSASVERAWHALTSMITDPKARDLEKMIGNVTIWRPFKMLYNKAREHRTAEIQRLREDPDEVVRLDREDRQRLAPTLFAAASNGISDGVKWRDRWLDLVGQPNLPMEEDEGTVTPGLSEVPDAPDELDDDEEQQQQQQQQQPLPQHPQNTHVHPHHLQQQLPQPPQPAHLAPGQDDQDMTATLSVIDHMFAQPTFQPTDLYPVLSSSAAKEMASAGMFGPFAHADLPRQDASLATFATGGQAGQPGQPGQASQSGTSTPQHPQGFVAGGPGHPQGTPLVDAMTKEYPPPWLWTDGGAQAAQLPGVLTDDADINMDENFDWQDFGQNLGGMTDGVWSSHGL